MPTSLSPETLLADRRWIEDLARRLVRDPNDADDVAQEAWRRILGRPPALVTSPRGWLHSVVKSCARELRRGGARREARERAASRPESTPGAADLVARADAHRAVLAAVLSLDPAAREVVLLRYFEDLEPWQIAKRLGEPQGTVRSRLHRALAALRGRLDDEHGGDRSRWAVALLGPGWKSAPSPSGTAAIAKGAVVMSTQGKVAAAAAVLLALVVVWWQWDGAPSAPPPARTVADATPAPAPAPRAPHRAGTKDDAGTTADAAPETAAAAASAAPVAARRPVRLEIHDVRHGEAGPPPGAGGPAPGVDSGEIAISGASGGGGAISGISWSKWKPVPEKGTATLRGKVLDRDGNALGGAEILRVDPAAGGADGDIRDFRHIRPVGESAADGTFSLAAQPSRPYRLVANWHNAMNRPTGLLLGGLVAVDAHENETVTGLVLRVPVDPREFGGVTGRVVDEDGAPLAVDVGIGLGLVAARSATDGRFRLWPVPAGDAEVFVQDYDFRVFRRAVTVRGGADSEVDVKLVRKVTGPQEIDGVVKDTDGRPLGGVRMLCGGIEDLYRRQLSGADGSFRFRGLPATTEGASYYVNVSGDGVVLKTAQGITVPAHGLVIVVDRAVKVRIVVRDAATGAVLPLFNVAAGRRVVEDGATIVEPVFESTEYEESGESVAELPPGEIDLTVEAPEHRAFHGLVIVPKEPGDYEVLVEMQR